MISIFIEITLWDGCSPENLLHIFRAPFPKNTSGGRLKISIRKTLKPSILFLESKSAQGSLSVSDLCNDTSCLNSKDAYDKIITDNAFYLNVREEFEKVSEISFLLFGIFFEANLVSYNT